MLSIGEGGRKLIFFAGSDSTLENSIEGKR